jgi:hypothetical protein
MGMCHEALARPLKSIIAKLKALSGQGKDRSPESAPML